MGKVTMMFECFRVKPSVARSQPEAADDIATREVRRLMAREVPRLMAPRRDPRCFYSMGGPHLTTCSCAMCKDYQKGVFYRRSGEVKLGSAWPNAVWW